MEKKHIILGIVGGVVFNLIFWQQGLGINLLFFVLMIIVIGQLLNPIDWKSPTLIGLVAGTIVASAMVVVNNSVISVFATFFGLFGLVGVLKKQQIRTYYTSVFTSFINGFNWIPDSIALLAKKETNKIKSWRILKLIIIPLVLILVFVVLFANANVVFGNFLENTLNAISNALVDFFQYFSLPRFFFIVFSIIVMGWVISRLVYTRMVDNELLKSNAILRIRRPNNWFTELFVNATKRKTIGLKNEFFSSKFLILTVASLVFIINVIDIIYVWFGVDYGKQQNMSAEVHEGVNILIAAIILSIIILLYVFRRNQNFYYRFKQLKNVALFWIIQNGILLISVAIRNFYYIEKQGLTIKRIGVFVFLIIVLFGLISLAIKITERKSFFYLSKVNAWFIYGVFIALSIVNWDNIIFNYNYSHRKSIAIDKFYLARLSDEVNVKLWQHRQELDIDFEHDYLGKLIVHNISQIENRLKNEDRTFCSWNLRDQRIMNAMDFTDKDFNRSKEYLDE